VSRLAYERLKSFCETSGISMSQFVESGINEKLDDAGAAPSGSLSATVTVTPIAPRPALPQRANLSTFTPRSVPVSTMAPPPVRPVPTPMTSAAARFAVEPPPPIIKPRPIDHEPKAPAEPTPGQIFTF
jgi:hypothetical protein